MTMLYKNEVLYNVRSVLWKIKERGGKVPPSFLKDMIQELQGQRAADVLNVSLIAMDKRQAYQGQATPTELAQLVAEAKKSNEGLLLEIARLRAPKEEK